MSAAPAASGWLRPSATARLCEAGFFTDYVNPATTRICIGRRRSGLQVASSNLGRCKIAHVKSGDADGYPTTEDLSIDEETLQRNLQTAIQEEDYSRAAKIRDDLRILHEDTKASLLAANTRFYNAFKNGDLAAMYSLWAKGDHVYVIHPAAGRISGYDVVMQSWEMVCGADYEFPLNIDLKNVEVHVHGDLGYVTCLEVVKTKGRTWGKQVATNVFEKVDGTWRMARLSQKAPDATTNLANKPETARPPLLLLASLSPSSPRKSQLGERSATNSPTRAASPPRRRNPQRERLPPIIRTPPPRLLPRRSASAHGEEASREREGEGGVALRREVMVLPLVKLGSLAFRTLSKPIAARLKHNAGIHPKFRGFIIGLAQVNHRFTTNMQRRLYGRATDIHIRPLNEEKAIQAAADLLGELFVAGTAIIYEVQRSARAEARKEEIRKQEIEARKQRIEELASEVQMMKKRISEIERQQDERRALPNSRGSTTATPMQAASAAAAAAAKAKHQQPTAAAA
uniref:SnoaL-like domain-containing protein n=1 Tax=Oryza glumipatula TaxID=40148 RepID=A0A0D9YF26_9ORYZ